MNEVPGEIGTEASVLIARYLMGRGHEDVFPWAYSAWVTSEGDERPEGSICTRHGHRPDGTPYPYWSVTGEVPEDIGRLICAAVNAYAAKGWRGWLIRRLSAPLIASSVDPKEQK